MLTRIARHSRSDLRITIYDSSGNPVAGLAPTIGITAGDGSVLVAAGTATDVVAGETGVYAYTLLPAKTALIDRITATWKYTISAVEQTITTYHDIVGAHYFALAELRELEPIDSTTTYTAAQLAEARDLASYALEDACNDWTWTERFRSHRFDGDGTRTVVLPYVGIRSIRSATIDGTAVDTTTLQLRPGGMLRRESAVWTREDEVVVNFTHYGVVSPDPDVSRAARLIAREVLFADALDGAGSGIPDRATSINSESGTFSLVTAGIGGAAFDLPELNAIVDRYRVYRYG